MNVINIHGDHKCLLSNYTCIDRARNLRVKFALRCSNLFIVYLCFTVLVRVIFLIVALLNNVKVYERFDSFPGSKSEKNLQNKQK